MQSEKLTIIRKLASEILGKKLTQQDASEIVHANPRAWQTWESGARPMGLDVLELFCLKTGIEYRPTILEDDKPIARKKPKLSIVPTFSSGTEFVTVTEISGLTKVVNTSCIVSFSLNFETKGARIKLVTGEIIDVSERPGEIRGMLNVMDNTQNPFTDN